MYVCMSVYIYVLILTKVKPQLCSDVRVQLFKCYLNIIYSRVGEEWEGALEDRLYFYCNFTWRC